MIRGIMPLGKACVGQAERKIMSPECAIRFFADNPNAAPLTHTLKNGTKITLFLKSWGNVIKLVFNPKTDFYSEALFSAGQEVPSSVRCIRRRQVADFEATSGARYAHNGPVPANYRRKLTLERIWDDNIRTGLGSGYNAPLYYAPEPGKTNFRLGGRNQEITGPLHQAKVNADANYMAGQILRGATA